MEKRDRLKLSITPLVTPQSMLDKVNNMDIIAHRHALELETLSNFNNQLAFLKTLDVKDINKRQIDIDNLRSSTITTIKDSKELCEYFYSCTLELGAETDAFVALNELEKTLTFNTSEIERLTEEIKQGIQPMFDFLNN